MTGLSLTVHTLEEAIVTTLESCYKHLALLLLDLGNKCQHYRVLMVPAAFTDANYQKASHKTGQFLLLLQALVCLPLLGEVSLTILRKEAHLSARAHSGHFLTAPILVVMTEL